MRSSSGLLVVLACAAGLPVLCRQPDKDVFAGRWDLTITTPQKTYPSWMEFTGTSENPEIRIVGRVASVHPATDVKQEGARLSFRSSESFGKEIPVAWELTISGNRITGIQKREDGVTGQIVGAPAPALKHKVPVIWSDPEPLFNGKDLSGWIPDAPSKHHWKAGGGALVNEQAGANIRTKRRFNDFRLHIEYNCPKDGNSGVYLRGRYEVQVEYEPPDENDKFHKMGSIYGFLAPAVDVTPRPGQWETYEITLVGRTVTVMRDGELIIDQQQIPGITGGALDSHQGEPGPIYLQGDHTGGMKYRNITISVPKR
ncbi:MAG TPA: DUF1080 domain-containing protein [Bryobacteraceae bacterium]|nr:DUF1080 domain-containing protein [Bryobacteraceae bacterium]